LHASRIFERLSSIICVLCMFCFVYKHKVPHINFRKCITFGAAWIENMALLHILAHKNETAKRKIKSAKYLQSLIMLPEGKAEGSIRRLRLQLEQADARKNALFSLHHPSSAL
jgi:hypothetical protein